MRNMRREKELPLVMNERSWAGDSDRNALFSFYRTIPNLYHAAKLSRSCLNPHIWCKIWVKPEKILAALKWFDLWAAPHSHGSSSVIGAHLTSNHRRVGRDEIHQQHSRNSVSSSSSCACAETENGRVMFGKFHDSGVSQEPKRATQSRRIVGVILFDIYLGARKK